MSRSSDSRRWSVEIFRVHSGERQQRILEAFRDIGRPEVTALGTQRGRDWFVVVETCSLEDRFFVRNTIASIDAYATRAYSFRPPNAVGPFSPAS